MNNFYQKLGSQRGNRNVVANDYSVTSHVKKGVTSCLIKTTYMFKGSTNVVKETLNLMSRQSNNVELTKIEITRSTSIKNLSINIRFLNDDDVLIFNETDQTLFNMSDDKLLTKLGITIVS